MLERAREKQNYWMMGIIDYYFLILLYRVTNREKKYIKRILKIINLACWRRTRGRKVEILLVDEFKMKKIC